MKKLLFVVGLIAAAFLAYYSVSSDAPRIQQDIKSRLVQAFVDSDISQNIKADVSGRDVILTGTVADEAEKANAYKTAANLQGVRAVKDQVMVVEPPSMASSSDPVVPEPVTVTEEDPFFGLDMPPPAEEVVVEESIVEEDVTENVDVDNLVDADVETEAEAGAEFEAKIEALKKEIEANPALKEEVIRPAGLTDVDIDVVDFFEAEVGAEAETESGTELEAEVEAETAEIEAPEIETPEVEATPEAADLDEPLVVRNAKIIRKPVDSVTAQKTAKAPCESNLTSLLEGNKINFNSGRATIKPSSHALLDRIVVAAKKCDEDTIITINGYTDNVGDVEANRQLSLERARAVGQYMLKRGVAKQVKVVGNGPNDPIADNDTEEGRAKNRRIEFEVLKANNEQE